MRSQILLLAKNAKNAKNAKEEMIRADDDDVISILHQKFDPNTTSSS
jgi:hypothetical protein